MEVVLKLNVASQKECLKLLGYVIVGRSFCQDVITNFWV